MASADRRTVRFGELGAEDYEALDDPSLVRLMRVGDEDAVHEFIARFEELLTRWAVRAGVPADELGPLVLDVLDDTAMYFIRTTGDPPPSLGTYLVSALRRAIVDRVRSTRRETAALEASARSLATGERAVGTLCSEFSLRAASGDVGDASDDDRSMPPDRAGVARAIAAELTAEERLILGWVAREVPYREIALWLGIKQPAAAQRIWRIRRRAREAAGRYYQSLGADEREPLAEVFRYLREGGGT